MYLYYYGDTSRSWHKKSFRQPHESLLSSAQLLVADVDYKEEDPGTITSYTYLHIP
jgi:hypothetical protein